MFRPSWKHSGSRRKSSGAPCLLSRRRPELVRPLRDPTTSAHSRSSKRWAESGASSRKTTMRAVYDRQGAADEVLVCGELPTPDAGYGEVRVKPEASGVNPSDTYRRRGPPVMEYPRVITNSDGAGIIDQVGPGVDRHRLGKRVWLYNGQRNGRWMGTAAEYIALSVDLVTELPDHVSFTEGATLGVPAMTAHRTVFVAGPVQGKILLVTGGAGAVGHYAVQLARWAGATVIATVSSSEKAERARAGGGARHQLPRRGYCRACPRRHQWSRRRSHLRGRFRRQPCRDATLPESQR